MPNRSASFLDHADTPLSVRNMLTVTCQVYSWSARHYLDQWLQRSEFAVHVHHSYLKAPVKVELVDFFKSLEDGTNLPVG